MRSLRLPPLPPTDRIAIYARPELGRGMYPGPASFCEMLPCGRGSVTCPPRIGPSPMLVLGGRSGDRSVDVEGVAPGRAATLPPLREAEVRVRWELLIYARAYDLGH